jgi:hypothetical protein
MRERGSVRRRREDASAEALRPAPRAPVADAMLALQRSVGNRALVQRLVYNATTGSLTIPTDYAGQRISWDGQYVPEEPLPEHDKSFLEHYKKDDVFRGHVKNGLNLGYVNAINPASGDEIKTNAGKLVSPALQKDDANPGDKAVYAKLVEEAAAAAVSHNHILDLPDNRFRSASALREARRAVMRPNDFLPGAPDLPGAGVDLLTTEIPGHKEKSKYITYACVLFALLKDNGFAKAKEITSRQTFPSDLYQAVQALHDHYAGAGVQYDDGSVRNSVMTRWGYTMLWAGETDWDKLSAEVSLAPGSYIFDITGHTVKVDVLQDISIGTPLTNPKTFFKPDSDPKNYTKDKEWKQKVMSIWKKA